MLKKLTALGCTLALAIALIGVAPAQARTPSGDPHQPYADHFINPEGPSSGGTTSDTLTTLTTYYTVNLAGRPMSGDSRGPDGASCGGIAYGMFNGVKVLFTAKHCRVAPYADVVASDGTHIGYWTGVTAADANDLTFIILYNREWPSTMNTVYAGSTTFVITADPSSSLGCSLVGGSGLKWGTTVYEAWNQTTTSTYNTRNGTTQGFARTGSNCEVQTSVGSHGSCIGQPCGRDSGFPFIAAGWTHTIFGWATTSQNITNNLQISLMYNGLLALRNAGYSVRLCHVYDCTS